MRSRDSPDFVEGRVTRVDLLAGSGFIWWGRDDAGEDLVGVLDGRVAVRSVADGLVVLARSRGWDRGVRLDADEGPVIDLRPVQQWVRSRGSLDAGSAVELWNLAVDVLRSTTGDRLTAGRSNDRLHGRLTEVALPYLAPGALAPSSWSSDELRRLHSMLDRADRVVREALQPI